MMAAKYGKKTHTAKGNKRYAEKRSSYTGRVGKKVHGEMQGQENWTSMVRSRKKEQAAKELPAGRFQGRFLAVEWRSSVVMGKERFVNGMFEAMPQKGASFVVGVEERESRADYLAVIRLEERRGWRDWKKTMMFGHGAESPGEGVFMRGRVPRKDSAEGSKAFVDEMLCKCEAYPEVWEFNEGEMKRVHDKGYARPGARKENR